MAARGDDISMNVHNHGTALDDRKKEVECRYCSKVVSGFYRLKFHLGGVRGDVAPCNEVPSKIQQLFRLQIEEAKGKGGANESTSTVHTTTEVATISVPSSTTHSLSPISKDIASFFYENGIDFSVANSPSFKRMLNGMLNANNTQGQRKCEIPTCQELKGLMLEEELKNVQEKVNRIRASWEGSGCTILIDEWVDAKGRCLLNFLVDCPEGPVYLRSSAISDIVGDNVALEQLLENVINDVGVKNVVQIVTSSTASRMWPASKLIAKRHRTIFWAVSASECFGLMLVKIATENYIKRVVEQAKVLTRFVHGNATLLNLFKDNTGHDLVKPFRIKSAIPFFTLESILLRGEALKDKFKSLEPDNSNWARAANVVEDLSFWNAADMALKATGAILRGLQLIDTADEPYISFIYETIDEVKERIQKEFESNDSQYLPLWKLIDEICNNSLHSPLHSAGYYLNPKYFYAEDFYLDDEVYSGLLQSIVRIVEDESIKDLIAKQLEAYSHADGAFGRGCVASIVNVTHPVLWWKEYGKDCPELQKFAIRILSQTCDGAGRYGLNRSQAEKLLTKGRNQDEQQWLQNLTFVHYNLQLGQFKFGRNKGKPAEGIDPMDDWITEIEAKRQDSAPFGLDGIATSADQGGPSEPQLTKRRQN